MAVEEPKYTVESKTDLYEVRKYDSVIVAETVVEADFESAGNQAFKILADYIFGNNQSKSKISMTAPVSQSKSEKISMTAPVSQSKSKSGYVVQFTMPAEYTLDTLPKPLDPRVQIKVIPPRRVVVHRYSGRWSESNYLEHLEIFKKELDKNGIQIQGEPCLNRYDPPFMPWFLRRNEISFNLT